MTVPVLMAAIALAFTGRPVEAHCVPGQAIQAWAYIGQRSVYYSQALCGRIVRGDGVGIFAALHELGHIAERTSSEREADCWAWVRYRVAARRWWHRTNAQVAAGLAEVYRWRLVHDHRRITCPTV